MNQDERGCICKSLNKLKKSTNSKSQEHSFEFQSYCWNTTLGNNLEYECIGLFADKW